MIAVWRQPRVVVVNHFTYQNIKSIEISTRGLLNILKNGIEIFKIDLNNDKYLQKNIFRIIGGLENELTILQIQIGQKIDLLSIGVRKVKNEISYSLDIGLNRICTEIGNIQNTRLDNMFENVRNLFIMNETKCDRKRDVIGFLIEHGAEYLDRQINEGFIKAESRNEFQLSTIENNIVVVYNM
jgi:hypothetical protein